MKVDSANSIVHQHLRDSRLAADADQHYGQLRQEVQTHTLGRAQSHHEASLRLAAHMEMGRGQNISFVV